MSKKEQRKKIMINFRVTDEEYARLEAEASRRMVTRAEVFRYLIMKLPEVANSR